MSTIDPSWPWNGAPQLRQVIWRSSVFASASARGPVCTWPRNSDSRNALHWASPRPSPGFVPVSLTYRVAPVSAIEAESPSISMEGAKSNLPRPIQNASIQSVAFMPRGRRIPTWIRDRIMAWEPRVMSSSSWKIEERGLTFLKIKGSLEGGNDPRTEIDFGGVVIVALMTHWPN